MIKFLTDSILSCSKHNSSILYTKYNLLQTIQFMLKIKPDLNFDRSNGIFKANGLNVGDILAPNRLILAKTDGLCCDQCHFNQGVF